MNRHLYNLIRGMGSIMDIWPAPRLKSFMTAISLPASSADEVQADVQQRIRDMWDEVKFITPDNYSPDDIVAWLNGLDRPGMTATEICDWYDQQKVKTDHDHNP